MTPIGTERTPTQKRLACGSINAKGAAPSIEIQITTLRPTGHRSAAKNRPGRQAEKGK